MIAVAYSCAVCGLANVAVDVPFQPEANATDWVREVVVPALNADHYRRSPHCKADKLAYSTSPEQQGKFT